MPARVALLLQWAEKRVSVQSRLCAAFLFAISLMVTISCDPWMKYEAGAENKNDKGEPVAASNTQPAANWADQMADEVRIDCDAPGCLRSVTFLGSWSVDELKPYEESNQTIDNGYQLWQAYFATENRYARVTIAIPDNEPSDPEGFSVVINNPGTVGVASFCAPGYSSYGTGLAATFGARGYIGGAVDYPGLGSEGVHPYLIKESEGKSSLDALRATRQLMSVLDIPLKDKDAIVGLSQGGHATLAAAELHEDDKENLDADVSQREGEMPAPSSSSRHRTCRPRWTRSLRPPLRSYLR